MTTITNSLAGGTSGTAITTGNSGGASGTAFDAVTIDADGECAYSGAEAVAAISPLSAALSTGASGTATLLGWHASSFGSPSQCYSRMYVYLTAYPPSTVTIYEPTSSSTALAFLHLSASGVLALLNAAGTAIFTFTDLVPLNQWTRIETFLDFSAGNCEVRLFLDPYNTTPDEDHTASGQAITGSFFAAHFGWNSSVANQPVMYLAGLGVSGTGFLGPAAGPPGSGGGIVAALVASGTI